MKYFLTLLLLSSTAFAADAPKFAIDNAIIDRAPQVPFAMSADMADMNSDGWIDFFIGAHEDVLPSAMFLQESGLVKYYDNVLNYAQPLPSLTQGGNRNSSNHFWFNFTGDRLGRLSFLGQDADRGRSALYPITDIVDGKPIYGPKKLGCPVETCVVLDPNNDGVLEYMDRGFLRNAAGVVLQTIKIGDKWPTGPQTVFDINGDTYPDILYVVELGYFQYNPTASLYEWQANKVQGAGIDPLAGAGHSTPLDYDNDGDQDYYTGQGHYSAVGADTVATIHGPNVFYPHLFRNDGGTFVDVTVESGLGVANLLRNQYYWTTYCATKAADVNADGWTDLVMCGERVVDNATGDSITIILNNGDGTFTVNRSNNFGSFKFNSSAGDRPAFALGDYNNDCKIDLVKTHTVTSPTIASIGLFKNTTTNTNHCLRVYAQGKTTGGLHATIKVRKAGTQTILGSQQIGLFTTGTRNLYPFFGLGSETLVDVDVTFQGGKKITVTNQPADHTLIVRENGEVVTNYLPGINPMLAIADVVAIPEEPDPIPDPEEPADPNISKLMEEIEMLEAEAKQYRATIATLEADQRSLNVRIETIQAENAALRQPKTIRLQATESTIEQVGE
jgi:hypothetical protein